MTMIDATVRLIPEVIGKESSHQDDSFSSGLLEYPHTRPYEYRGMTVPDVLMSGHHEKYPSMASLSEFEKTLERRPDLLENYELTAEEEKIVGTN